MIKRTDQYPHEHLEGSPEEAAQFVRDNTAHLEKTKYGVIDWKMEMDRRNRELAAAGDHIAKLDKLSHDLAKQLQRSMERNAKMVLMLTAALDHCTTCGNASDALIDDIRKALTN